MLDTTYGEALKKKMVNYAIVLENLFISTSRVGTQLEPSAGKLKNISPSNYSPLYYNPIPVGIETKTSDGPRQDRMVQLPFWATV